MPYADYSSFDITYFEGIDAGETHPAGFNGYRDVRFPYDLYIQEYTNNISQISNRTILIVGCGYGYTIEKLIDDYGADVYGMDVSSYAVNNTPISYPNRIYEGDATVISDITSVENSAGVPHFNYIISENMLSCLTDSEAQDACSNMSDKAQKDAIHILWSDKTDMPSEWYNKKPLSDWQSLCDPGGEYYWIDKGDIE